MSVPEYLLVCRLCVLKNSSYANIFNTTDLLEIRIADVINELLQLNVYPGDGLPDRVCCDCLNELARFKRFKNISHEAKITLTAIIKSKNPSTPKPSTSKENDSAKDNFEVVDLVENDDDSSAETLDPPSPKPELPCIELIDSDTEMENAGGSEEVSFLQKEAEKEVVGMSTERDPLESDLELDSESRDMLDDDMEADIVELEEEEEFYEDEALLNHCSRTLGYDKNSKKTKNKAEMVSSAVTSPSVPLDSLLNCENMSEDDFTHEDDSAQNFSCKRCKKVFSSNVELNIHTEKYDCGFSCSNCNKNISSTGDVDGHASCCGKSKLHICGICDKTFESELSLRMHMKDHGSKKAYPSIYVCKKCNKAFNLRKIVKLHEKKCKFVNIKSEFIGHYVCGVCREGFKDYLVFKKHFDSHMNIQKEAFCGFCETSYSSALECRKHVWACHGTLECDICAKRFLESYFLNRHYVSHTGDKPYACNKCPKTYKSQYSLNMHMENVH